MQRVSHENEFVPPLSSHGPYGDERIRPKRAKHISKSNCSARTDKPVGPGPWETRGRNPEAKFQYRNVQRANIALAIVIVFAVGFKAGLFQSAYDFLIPDASPPVLIREGVQWTNASRSAMSPLTISSPPGNKSFAVKVVEERSNRQIAMLFIGPGRSVDIRLDPGVYKLRVATGRVWRGDGRLFGRETDFFETIPMQFTVGANGYSGRYVRLGETLAGNLPKTQISKDTF